MGVPTDDRAEPAAAHAGAAACLPGVPGAIKEHIMGWLAPAEVCLLGLADCLLRRLAHSDRLWQGRLGRTFPDARADRAHASSMASFAALAFRRTGLACPCEPGCRGSLFGGPARRCPCVAVRTKLPLCLGSLSERRSGSSALSGGGFGVMLATLRRHFDFEHRELATLQGDTLAPLDVLVLCTTEGPALEDAELAALRAWVESGGALIASAFANWSAYGHYASKTVGWLGVETIPHTGFRPLAKYSIAAPEPGGPCGDATGTLLRGPFGQVDQFANMGESDFRVLDDAASHGAVQLAPTLVFYPPRRVDGRGATGRGRALVCSNYHWLADPEHWNGGLFALRGGGGGPGGGALRPNQALLLNFVAGAIAARADS